MSRSGAASDLAKGKKFLKQLLYVQLVDEELDTASTISEISLREYLLENCKIFSDPNFAEYMRNVTLNVAPTFLEQMWEMRETGFKRNPFIANEIGHVKVQSKSSKANVRILKSCLKDEISDVKVYSNPLPAIPLESDVAIHAFVVFQTENWYTHIKMWWSLEKNGQYIVLQQSPNEDDVTYKLYDAEKKQHVQRLEPVELLKIATGHKHLEYLLRAIWETNQLNNDYHLLFANCQNFASFVFKKANYGGGKWSTRLSATVERFGLRNKKTNSISPAELVKYNWIVKDDRFDYYKALIEGRRKDFEELASNLPSESLNSVDSQGYTLLEWATAFSTSDWPIDQFLKERGAEIQTDEGMFRRNVFFIALQYLPSSNKELELKSQLLSFDGIDIHGVNKTDDTALHLALYGEKWDVAEKILDQFPDYDANTTNCMGDAPIHLAVKFRCKLVLTKKILVKTNSENVIKLDRLGNTVLNVAIMNKSTTLVEELLKRKDVDVNIKDNNNQTALHLACCWEDMPIDLFRKILEKSTDVNEDEEGCTALHWAILRKSKAAVRELLKHKDVDVGLKTNDNITALHLASRWKNMPIDLFNIILERSTDVNAQDKYGRSTALHWAIENINQIVVEELLKQKDVDVNIKDNCNETALHLATWWKDNMPIDLFRKILEKSTDVNAQDEEGCTALHYAIRVKFKAAVRELLKREDVDVSLKNKSGDTAFDLCSEWKNIPHHLFKIISDKATDAQAQNEAKKN